MGTQAPSRLRSGTIRALNAPALPSEFEQSDGARKIGSADLPGAPKTHYGSLFGASVAMRRLFAILEQLEASLVNVLIEGESGTGKELVARGVHEHSRVRRGPFIGINCGALQRELVRSELFGHRRGAFTSAVEDSAGAFATASGGTLFLDEVGELPLDVQPILLRVLESGRVVRVGESQERPVEVRVVAATNRDLEAEIAEGRFREDLFYRLAVVRVRTTPLRERPEDIELIADHFAAALGMPALPESVKSALRQRPWRGNVRELRSAISAYSVFGELPDTAPLSAPQLKKVVGALVDVRRPYAEQKEELLEAFMRTYIENLLVHTCGNQTEAARISGLERGHLNKLVNRFKRGP